MGDGRATSHSSSNVHATPEFEHLLEWVRLIAARAGNRLPCMEQHRQNLRALGETEQRLNALDHWRQSGVFTEREKTALRLSEAISLNDPAEYSLVGATINRFLDGLSETSESRSIWSSLSPPPDLQPDCEEAVPDVQPFEFPDLLGKEEPMLGYSVFLLISTI